METLCLMRGARTLHEGKSGLWLTPKLKSFQHAMSISTEREAVRMRNLSASFVASLALELLIAAIHSSTSQ